MKANQLLKHNIDTLLKARGQTRRDLAGWVRQSLDAKKIDPWISQIFTNPEREIQAKYLDRIADFFGLAVYQLFQPGISPLTERRKGADRRSGRDRRVSHLTQQMRGALSPARADVTEEDIADLLRLRTLSSESRAQLRQDMDALARSERQSVGQGRRRPAAETGGDGATGHAKRPSRRQAGGE